MIRGLFYIAWQRQSCRVFLPQPWVCAWVFFVNKKYLFVHLSANLFVCKSLSMCTHTRLHAYSNFIIEINTGMSLWWKTSWVQNEWSSIIEPWKFGNLINLQKLIACKSIFCKHEVSSFRQSKIQVWQLSNDLVNYLFFRFYRCYWRTSVQA